MPQDVGVIMDDFILALSEMNEQSGAALDFLLTAMNWRAKATDVSLSVVGRGKVQSCEEKQPDDRKFSVSSPTACSMLIKLQFLRVSRVYQRIASKQQGTLPSRYLKLRRPAGVFFSIRSKAVDHRHDFQRVAAVTGRRSTIGVCIKVANPWRPK